MPAGRPSKLTENFLEAAEKIINEDINAIILTDEELIDAINELLEEEAQITHRTFMSWKAKNKEDYESIDENGKRFLHLVKKALRKQKAGLFDKFREEPNQWQRWAWILERKFDDWNIRTKVETEHKGSLAIGFDDSQKHKIATELIGRGQVSDTGGEGTPA